MITEFQKQKLTKLFNLYDTDGDGFITKADYERIAKSYAETRDYRPGSLEYNVIYYQFQILWNDLQKAIDTNLDGKVSLDEYLENRNNPWHLIVLASSLPINSSTLTPKSSTP